MTTHITCVLDKSGSMEGLQQEVISGFNAFLAEQRKVADDALVTVLLFDTEITVPVTGAALSEVADLDSTRYRPSGCTALNDALIRAIRETEGRVAEGDRALILVVTDGQENSSRETTKQQVVNLIGQVETRGNWTFTYMSAHPDGFADAQSYGIALGNVAAFAATPDGTKAAFSAVSGMTASYRSSTALRSRGFYGGTQGGAKVGSTPKPTAPPPKPEGGAETTWTRSA